MTERALIRSFSLFQFLQPFFLAFSLDVTVAFFFLADPFVKLLHRRMPTRFSDDVLEVSDVWRAYIHGMSQWRLYDDFIVVADEVYVEGSGVLNQAVHGSIYLFGRIM